MNYYVLLVNMILMMSILSGMWLLKCIIDKIMFLNQPALYSSPKSLFLSGFVLAGLITLYNYLIMSQM